MWPEVELTLLCRQPAWDQIANWLRLLNSTCKSDYKSWAGCPIKNFWFGEKKILVNFRDLSWPDLDPDPYSVWHLCSLVLIFTSSLTLLLQSFDQKLSILPRQYGYRYCLGFTINQRQNFTFELTLTRELRSILKSYVWFGEISWRASERRLAGLNTTIGSRGSGRGLIRPPSRRSWVRKWPRRCRIKMF